MREETGRRGFRLVTVLIGIVAGLGAAEIGLRLAIPPSSEHEVLAELAAGFEAPPRSGDCRPPAKQARLREIVDPSRHRDLIYELRPDVDTCFEGVPVRTSPQGVRRDSVVRSPKPQGTYRVLALGDSHAFGWAIPERATVAAQFEEALGALTPSVVEVVNAGVPGYSAYQEAAWLEAHGADFEPDCVVVLFVANDMGLPHFLLRPERPGPSMLWERVKAATSSKRWFTFAPNELATFVSEVDMDRIPDRYRHMAGEAGYRQALRKLAGWADGSGADLVNVFDYSTLEVDSGELVDFQRDLGITALEMSWPMNPAFRISESDPHLNRLGNAAVVDSVVEGLESRSVCLPPAGRP
jgi:lysophospholipase L1-like esterase